MDYLLDGINNGFDTGITLPLDKTFECANLLSARQHPEFVTQALSEEVSAGYMFGPYNNLPFSSYRVSPIGVAEHKYSAKKRLTLDLSSPHDNPQVPSINSTIDKDKFSLKYVRVDDAISLIKQLGRGSKLVKVDVKNAFRNLPIQKSQWKYHC